MADLLYQVSCAYIIIIIYRLGGIFMGGGVIFVVVTNFTGSW